MGIHGVTITLYTKVSAGRDAFNRELWDETPVEVENVLIAPVSQTDTAVLSEMSLNGKKAQYVLGIPKGDTHSWEDAKIEFWGQTWRSVGYVTQGIDDLIPLSWNKKVVVERCG